MGTTWKTQDENADADNGDWTKTAALQGAENSDWSVTTALQSSENSDWTTDDLWSSQNTRADRDAWNMDALSPNASGRDRTPGWANWGAEDFRFKPEDVDFVPDDVQSDNHQWTIEEQAD